jgi:hypothetical protein
VTEEPQEVEERPRPRVVDKRVSARGESSAPVRQPSEPQAPPRADPPPQGAAAQVWTPEQEAQAQALLQQIAQTPAVNLVVNAAMSLIDVASVKLQTGQLADAQIAIDALDAVVDGLSGRLATAETPLRQALGQLQLAYAEAVAAVAPPNPAQP